ncbi:hypothetical protein [Serratia fonticola]|uniref:hypothetical protein n=1 Tax=Serratia fonticola TaxID=47917 RepID=UPI0021AE1ACB|nr:hypothetical protein [Serratia fonticola]
MINFITAIISALFGALVVIVTNWWRTRYTIREQDFSKRVEEIIKKIETLEDLSCKYWAEMDINARSEISVNSIVGKKTQLELLIGFVISKYENLNEKLINDALAVFNDTITGDEFEVKNESFKIQPMKIQAIHIHAEELKLTILTERVRNY